MHPVVFIQAKEYHYSIPVHVDVEKGFFHEWNKSKNVLEVNFADIIPKLGWPNEVG